MHDRQGPLDIWLIDVTHLENGELAVDALQSPLKIPYFVYTYVNRLNGAQDVRRLAIDIFLGSSEIRPHGNETRPGIWVGDGAQLHSNARLVAPAYVGKDVKIGASTLITRFSNVERGSHVDSGTVIEDASVLPDTYVGTGLDVCHAVIYRNTLVHFKKNVVLEIDDAALIGKTSNSNVLRNFGRKRTFVNRPAQIASQLAASFRRTMTL
jgi:NDP-sugar pyrophosphorylase family protein